MSFSFFRDRWNQGFYFKRFSNLGYVYTMPHYYKGGPYVFSQCHWNFITGRAWIGGQGDVLYSKFMMFLLRQATSNPSFHFCFHDFFFFIYPHIPPFRWHEFWASLVLGHQDAGMKMV